MEFFLQRALTDRPAGACGQNSPQRVQLSALITDRIKRRRQSITSMTESGGNEDREPTLMKAIHGLFLTHAAIVRFEFRGSC